MYTRYMTLDTTNPAVQAAIQQLEDDPTIAPKQKALVLLVADGLKPSTWQQIHSEKWAEGDVQHTLPSQRWDTLIGIFNGLGLHYVTRSFLDDATFVQPKDGPHMWMEITNIFLASHPGKAEELARAVHARDDEAIGKALGFPATAIEAYVNKETIPFSDWPTSTDAVDANSMKFLNHMISKENWQQEIAYLPQFANRVKELSQKIYDDRISS